MHLNEINIRDPFILPHNGKYYMYGSRVDCQTGFDVYISSDLENWSEPKSVFEYYSGFYGTTDFWAPEVYYYNNKFYMFASFKSDIICRGTGVLICDKPDGEFLPHSDMPVTPREWECLDGSLYIENDVPYMIFSHEWTQIGDGEICIIQLSEDLKKSVGTPKTIFKASEADWTKAIDKNQTQFVTDGPFVYRDENNDLYMLWASMGTYGYTQGAAKSDNGRIDGKWDLSKTIFDKDGGHGMIFRGYDGERYLVLHKPNKHLHERPVLIKI